MEKKYLENPKEFWKIVLGDIQLRTSPMVYNSFFYKTEVKELTKDSIHLLCKDEFVKTNIERKHKAILQEALAKYAHKDLAFELSINKAPQEIKQASVSAKPAPLFDEEATKAAAQTVLKEKQERSKLSPKFTFENYIMGKNNNLAYAVATAVADKPGELYNPVFIHSGVGLGKTHLIQAIGNHIIKNKPGLRVVYTTGESFTNELVEAIQSGKGKGRYTTNEFRNKFRKADVFLIDDIQFIIGRDATQEEFFHTFNELYMSQKQIVITSDRPPKEFNELASRITSRFSSGIIVDIQTPDFETRAAILRNKRDTNGDNLPNNVIDFIAEKMPTNIRELEGAYIKVLTTVRANNTPATVEAAAEALGQIMDNTVSRKNINVNQVLKAVCTYYSVKLNDLKGESRVKEFVIPRQVAMYLIKDITDTPYMTIGQFLGGRDHTTIMHGIEKIKGELQALGKVSQDVDNVKRMIFSTN